LPHPEDLPSVGRERIGPYHAALWGSCMLLHPGGNPGANLKSISNRCYLFEVAFVWELTKETIVLPLGCLQAGVGELHAAGAVRRRVAKQVQQRWRVGEGTAADREGRGESYASRRQGRRLGTASHARGLTHANCNHRDPTLEATQGQILSQSPTDATSSR